MDFVLLSGLFALAVTLHNLEEALLLPTWSRSAGRWHHPVGAREFRFAVAVLTVFAYVIDGKAAFCDDQNPFAYEREGENYFDIQADRWLGNRSLVLFEDGDQILVNTENDSVRFHTKRPRDRWPPARRVVLCTVLRLMAGSRSVSFARPLVCPQI